MSAEFPEVTAAALEKQMIARGVFQQPSVDRELRLIEEVTLESARAQAAILTLRQVLTHLDHGHIDVARNDIRFFFRNHH
jgi:hypothetical protein